MIAYEIGQRAKQWTTTTETHASRLTPYLQDKPFESVLIMRLLYLPHELVSYGCGWLELEKRPYFFGTLIGLIPSTIVLSSVGASIRNGLITSTSLLSPTMVLVNGGILVGSIVVANRLRQSEPANQETAKAFVG